jgi:hypothetical protein
MTQQTDEVKVIEFIDTLDDDLQKPVYCAIMALSLWQRHDFENVAEALENYAKKGLESQLLQLHKRGFHLTEKQCHDFKLLMRSYGKGGNS